MEPGDRTIASEWPRKGDSVDHHGFQFSPETFSFDPDNLDYIDLGSHFLSGAMVFPAQTAVCTPWSPQVPKSNNFELGAHAW